MLIKLKFLLKILIILDIYILFNFILTLFLNYHLMIPPILTSLFVKPVKNIKQFVKDVVPDEVVVDLNQKNIANVLNNEMELDIDLLSSVNDDDDVGNNLLDILLDNDDDELDEEDQLIDQNDTDEIISNKEQQEKDSEEEEEKEREAEGEERERRS